MTLLHLEVYYGANDLDSFRMTLIHLEDDYNVNDLDSFRR